MALNEMLDTINTKSKNILADSNTALVAKGVPEVATLSEIPEAIESIANGDTSLITDWSYFCYKGYRADIVSSLDTSKGTNFLAMFTTADITEAPYINTSSGTNFEGIFAGCISLSKVPELNTSRGINFANMFSGTYSLTSIPLIDTSSGKYFTNMFSGCSKLSEIPPLDLGSGVEFTSMFGSCSALKTVPELNTQEGKKFDRMFYDCFELTEVPFLDTKNGNQFSSLFSGCSKLKRVVITTANADFDQSSFNNCSSLESLTIGAGFDKSIYLTTATALTQESLHGMIENLADLTGLTTKNFAVGETNLAKIDEEHIAMLEAKNWTYS